MCAWVDVARDSGKEVGQLYSVAENVAVQHHRKQTDNRLFSKL